MFGLNFFLNLIFVDLQFMINTECINGETCYDLCIGKGDIFRSLNLNMKSSQELKSTLKVANDVFALYSNSGKIEVKLPILFGLAGRFLV